MSRQDIIVKLRLAGEDFDRDFKVKFQDLEAAAERQSAAAGARSGGGFMKGFLGAAGIAGLGTAIGSAISSAADLGAEIASTSRQFNIGAEELQVWRQAASSAGVTASEFNGALGSLTQKIGEANAGNRQAQQSFVDLGIGFQTTAGQARATDAVMLDLAKRISEIDDPAKRVQLGMQLLGDDFKNLYPLLLNGADAFNATAAEVGGFGDALSAKEIADLDATNRKIEEMKNQLSRSVAKVVAENAAAISDLIDQVEGLADAAIRGAGAWFSFTSALGDYSRAADSLPKDLTPQQRQSALAGLDAAYGRRDNPMSPLQRLMTGERAMTFSPASPYSAEFVAGFRNVGAITYPQRNFVTGLLSEFEQARRANEGVEDPRLTGGGGGGSRRRAGGSTRARTGKTEEEKAAEAALKAEERMRDAVARTLREQKDSADLAAIRQMQGDRTAAIAEVELALVRQIPGIEAKTVEELGKALGLTEKMVEERREQLELQLESNKAAIEGKKAAAAEAFDDKKRIDDLAAQKARDDEIAREAQRWEAEYERAVLNVANIYETAFRGGTDDLWRNFKDEGTRMIAEVAAQWTLAMIAGQPFSFNSAMGGAFSRSPLSSIFFGAGGRGGFDATLFGGAANDNGRAGVPGFGGGIFGGSFMRANGRGGDLLPSGADAGLIPNGLGGGASFLQNPAFALGLGTVATSLFGNGSTGSQLGGLVGSVGGQALGSTIGALGAFGGPIGAIAGAILGSVLPGLLSGTPNGNVTIGNAGGTLGITGSAGGSSSRRQTATQGAGSLIDAIFQIADQLGGSVDASRGSVSFGVRGNSFRVDPNGRGTTRVGRGAVDFGSDQEGAIRFAIQDLIRDGVITGISQASQNLLQRGGDLEAQIEKALLIEQIPKLLRQRLDPLGAALDELYDKFKLVNDALIEGAASAEQIAQARQLWELERADAIASIGAASQSLKDFLASLNAGSNSPLSLREQRAEAERQLEPFLAQITAAEGARAEVERLRASGGSAAEIAAAEEAARTAAAAINQDGFTQASQLLLSISRQSNASSGAFFSDFDRIRALTGSAIGFIDQAAARNADTRDPFARETAQNTADIAAILADHTRLLQAINDNFTGSGGGFASDFLRDPRLYVSL